MRKVKEETGRAEVVSFDVSTLPEHELRELFCDLPLKSLEHWLNYYVGKEQYEVCKVIKQYIDIKSK
jgi:hypothetical protein